MFIYLFAYLFIYLLFSYLFLEDNRFSAFAKACNGMLGGIPF